MNISPCKNTPLSAYASYSKDLRALYKSNQKKLLSFMEIFFYCFATLGLYMTAHGPFTDPAKNIVFRQLKLLYSSVIFAPCIYYYFHKIFNKPRKIEPSLPSDHFLLNRCICCLKDADAFFQKKQLFRTKDALAKAVIYLQTYQKDSEETPKALLVEILEYLKNKPAIEEFFKEKSGEFIREAKKIKKLVKKDSSSLFVPEIPENHQNLIENLFTKIMEKNTSRSKEELKICMYCFTFFSLSGLYIGAYAEEYGHSPIATALFLNCYLLPPFLKYLLEKKIKDKKIIEAISSCKSLEIKQSLQLIEQLKKTLPVTYRSLKSPSTSLKSLQVVFDNHKNNLKTKTSRKAGDVLDLSYNLC